MSDTKIVAVPHQHCILPSSNRRIIRDELAPLIISIKTNGLFQPAGAVKHEGKFRLVWGVRRYYATKAAGLSTLATRILPAETTAADELRYSIAENHCRLDETFADTVDRVQHAAELLGCSFAKAALAVHVKPAYASKCQKIENSLPDDAKEAAQEHKVGFSVLYEISKAATDAAKMELLMSYINGSLTRDQIATKVKGTKPARPTTNLTLQVDDASLRLSLPADADYDAIVGVLGKAKKELMAHKNTIPLKLLPQVLKEAGVS